MATFVNIRHPVPISVTDFTNPEIDCCLVPWLGQSLVGRTIEWVANPLGLTQTSALQIKTRYA